MTSELLPRHVKAGYAEYQTVAYPFHLGVVSRKLFTPNTDWVLDPPYARDEAWRVFRPQLEVAREITNFGSNLLKRPFARSQQEVSDLVVISVLFRQSLAALDGTVLCLENGAVHASKLHARALLEASLFIEWVLKKGKDRWGKQLYVWSIRQERHWVRRVIPGTDENRAFADSWREAFGEEWQGRPDIENSAKEQEAEIDALLLSDTYRVINDWFEAYNRNPGVEPDWFRPGPGGVGSLYKLAERLGRRAEYNTFYKSLSYAAHGARTRLHISVGPDAGTVSLEPIRYLEDFPFVFTTAINLTLRIFRALIQEYRPDEEPAFRETYISQWRSRLKPPQVTVNPDHQPI